MSSVYRLVSARVPKVGENHRPAIKSFTIPQKIQLLQTTCI